MESIFVIFSGFFNSILWYFIMMRFYFLLFIFICTNFTSFANAISLGSQQDLMVNVGDSIFFNSNRADLDGDALSLLDDQIRWLKKNYYNKNCSDPNIHLLGFTDLNEKEIVGQFRALNIKFYFSSKGINSDCISILNLGKQFPAVKESNENAFSQNRRVVTMIDEKKVIYEYLPYSKNLLCKDDKYCARQIKNYIDIEFARHINLKNKKGFLDSILNKSFPNTKETKFIKETKFEKKWKEKKTFCQIYPKASSCENKINITKETSSHICNLEQPIEFLKEKALEFYNQENLEDTFTCSKIGALLNDPYSTGILGWHYQFGIGVDIDLVEANKWYQKGVSLDDNYSKVNLAKNLTEGIGITINEKKAFQLVKEAAKTGYDIAEAELAFYYLKSIGTPANYDEAFKYFKLAAEKGNVFAQGYLGWMYAGGRGTEIDYEKGFLWTKKAADQNNVYAQANLGWHYFNGFGVEKNLDLANEYYKKAEAKGNEYAKEQLKILNLELLKEKEKEKEKVKIKQSAELKVNTSKLNELEKKAKLEKLQNEILQKSKPIEEEFLVLKNTNVREKPTINSDKIDLLKEGSTIYVIGQFGEWYIVEKDNALHGFVFSKLLAPNFLNNTEPPLAVINDLQLIDPPKIIIDNPGKYHALVIGNNKYEYWSRLDAAVNDAKEIGQILESKYNFTVTPLINADRDEIMNAIYYMRENLTADDNLLIYFAGHGELDKKAERGYWIPIDGDLNKPTKWISNQYIIDQMKASEAKHIMVITDSCFSASLMRGKTENNTSNSFNQLSKMKTRIILTSGGLGPVFDGGGENNHSVFASVLIKALLNKNEPFVTGEIFPQIREYVQNNVDPLYVCDDDGNNCEKEYQTPEFSILGKTGHAGGDFIFVPN